jgi:hypothetical protein
MTSTRIMARTGLKSWFVLFGACLRLLPSSEALASVPTQHNNNARTGEYSDSTGNLDPQYVKPRQFGFLWSYPVDGFVYAQPLMADAIAVAGKGTHDLVLIATNNNSLYSFDAHSSGAPLWTWGQAHGMPLPPMDHRIPDMRNCGIPVTGHPFGGEFSFGILGTPAISGNYIYFVAEHVVTNPCVWAHTLYQVDLKTGTTQHQVDIAGTVNGIAFNPLSQIQRPGLIVQNGLVSAAFGSSDDEGPFHGWVFTYNASDLTVNLQNPHYCTTCQPGAEGGAIWQGGSGLTGDGSSLYFITGNPWPPGTVRSNSDGIIKLTGARATAFLPTRDEAGDCDLGSGGTVFLPNPAPHPVGSPANFVIGGGKDGTLFLTDPVNIGFASPPSYTVPGGSNGTCTGRELKGAPAYWKEAHRLYVWPSGALLTGLVLANNGLTPMPNPPTTPVPRPSGPHGASVSLSRNVANGTPFFGRRAASRTTVAGTSLRLRCSDTES